MKKITELLNKVIAWLNVRIDKVAHFGMGYIIATVFPIPALYGLIIAVVIGALKEIRDLASKKGTPDIWDFVVTVLGACLGYFALIIK